MSDPIDDTQPHPTTGPGPTPNVLSTPPTAAPPPLPAGPPLQAAPPPGTPTDWREPAWYPPQEHQRDRGPSLIAILVGLGILLIGLYYFVDRTLGITLPSLRWGTLWPLILIVVGGLIVVRAMGRRR